MKNNSLYFFLGVIILAFSGCCKDIPCLDLTPEDRSWMPYKNNDTLIFKNFENDSIISYITEDYRERDFDVKEAQLGCVKTCLAGAEIHMDSDVNYKLDFYYFIEKSDSDKLYVIADGTFMSPRGIDTSGTYYYFYLDNSVLLDSVLVANHYYNNVYEYTSLDEYDMRIKKMYVKKGRWCSKNNTKRQSRV